ncbi:MAG TPA: Sec-independent protein translocase protein TatB [Pseudolabrys sp.]|nr:Sec-independent protein translocase protein TatB [Pseudolabrys sp.]
MFELDWGKLVIIGIVALIVIGPKELPTVLRTLGQWMGKVKRMASEFQGQFQEALREAEMADLKKHADDLRSTVTDFATMDPLAEPQPTATPPTTTETEPTPAETAQGQAAPVTPVIEAAPPAPAFDLSPPERPVPVSEKDFAAIESPPAKQAGSAA